MAGPSPGDAAATIGALFAKLSSPSFLASLIGNDSDDANTVDPFHAHDSMKMQITPLDDPLQMQFTSSGDSRPRIFVQNLFQDLVKRFLIVV